MMAEWMMAEWKLRLLNETRELAIKLNCLNKSMSEESFTKLNRIEKDLLYEQNIYMTKYIQVLGKRLEVYGIKFTKNE